MPHEFIEYSSFDELCCDSAYYDGMCPEAHQTECLQCPEPPNAQAWVALPRVEIRRFFQSVLDTE